MASEWQVPFLMLGAHNLGVACTRRGNIRTGPFGSQLRSSDYV